MKIMNDDTCSCITGLLVAMILFLTGCGNSVAVKKAGEGAKNRIENYAKNQDLIHFGEQKAYEIEAKAHLDTKFMWSAEKVTNIATADKSITPAEIVSKMVANADARRDGYIKVESKVKDVRTLIAYSQKDLHGAQALFESIERYNDASSFNIFGLFTKAPPEPVVEPPINLIPAVPAEIVPLGAP